MKHVNSIRALHDHGYSLHTYCPRCDQWRLADLGALVRGGLGSLRPPEHWSCRTCGEVGPVRVREPRIAQAVAAA
jgi:hypothetical protein